jgi:hypothetical protein
MTFVLEKSSGGLLTFPGEAQAIAYCERIDVEAGEYAFFGDDGSPLEPILQPHRKALGVVVESTAYSLEGSNAGANLSERVNQIRYVESDQFTSIDAVIDYLKGKQRG